METVELTTEERKFALTTLRDHIAEYGPILEYHLVCFRDEDGKLRCNGEWECVWHPINYQRLGLEVLRVWEAGDYDRSEDHIDDLRAEVNKEGSQYPELRGLAEDSPEWLAVLAESITDSLRP